MQLYDAKILWIKQACMLQLGAITKDRLRVTSQAVKSGQHFYGAMSDVGRKYDVAREIK